MESTLQIKLNGKPHCLPAPLTIAGLLQQLDVSVRYVAVEVNRELVPRSLHEQRLISEGDEVEVVTLVGGG